jgi:hypothetical protein
MTAPMMDRNGQHNDREADQQAERPSLPTWRFASVPNDFYPYVPKIGLAATAVYVVLCKYANRERVCWPSAKRMMSDTGLSKPTYWKAVRTLEQFGLVMVNRRPNQPGARATNVYRLPLPQTSKESLPSAKDLTGYASGDLVKDFDQGLVKQIDHELHLLEQQPIEPHPKNSRPKRSFVEEDMATGRWMHELNQELQPGRKAPNFEEWANTIRLLRERDGKTDDQIRDLYQWCHQDSFWCTNILSPDKLRAKWDDLELRRSKGTVRAGQGGRSGSSVRLSSPAHVRDPERKYSDETRVPLLAAAEPAKGDPISGAV